MTPHRPGFQRYIAFPIPKSLLEGAEMSALNAMALAEQRGELLLPLEAQWMLSGLNQLQIRIQSVTSALSHSVGHLSTTRFGALETSLL